MRRKVKAIKDALQENSGTLLLSRDISECIRDYYKWGLSGKSVGKYITVLEDEGYVEKIKHSVNEANSKHCRYSYRWIPKDELTMVSKDEFDSVGQEGQ